MGVSVLMATRRLFLILVLMWLKRVDDGEGVVVADEDDRKRTRNGVARVGVMVEFRDDVDLGGVVSRESCCVLIRHWYRLKPNPDAPLNWMLRFGRFDSLVCDVVRTSLRRLHDVPSRNVNVSSETIHFESLDEILYVLDSECLAWFSFRFFVELYR